MSRRQDVCVLVVLSLCLCFHLSFGGPLLLSNGDLDKVAVEQHILSLEDMVVNLQTQLHTQEQKQAAVVSSLLSKLVSTSDELSNLKIEFDDLDAKYNPSLTEMSEVRGELTTNTKEQADVQARLKSLKSDYNTLDTELALTKADLMSTSKDLQHTKTEMAELKKKHDAALMGLNSVTQRLNSTVTHTASQETKLNTTGKLQEMASQITATSAAQGLLQQQMSNVKSDVLPLNRNISHLQHSLNNVSDKLMERTQRKQAVAFSAVLTSDVLVKSGQAMKYGKVLLNSKDGYNRNTGIFTCPENGIYHFYSGVITPDGKNANIQLHHNSQAIARVPTYDAYSHTYSVGSSSAIIQAKQGDQISVRSTFTSKIYNERDQLLTAFSGFLVD